MMKSVANMDRTGVNDVTQPYRLCEESCRNVRVDSRYVEVGLTQELDLTMMTSIAIPAAGEVTQDVKMQDSNTI